MNSIFRLSTVAIAAAAALALTGCQEYFGTNDGFEDGAATPWGVGGQVAGTADFEIVGVTPENADVGDQVEVVMVSEADAPVGSFDVDSFWFCTFDGESAMLETGGDDFEAEVDPDIYTESDDINLTTEDVENGVISTVTFTVPDGTVTGEGLVFVPNGDVRYFELGIQ